MTEPFLQERESISHFSSRYSAADDDDAAYQAWAEAQAEEYYAEMERAAAEQQDSQPNTISLP